MSAAQPSDVPVGGSGGNEAHRGAVGALARVLMQTEHPDRNDAFYVHFLPEWRAYAERILADPGPLLEALATAGVLTRVTATLPPRSDPMYPRGRGGVHWAAERYVSEWQPDSKWEEGR